MGQHLKTTPVLDYIWIKACVFMKKGFLVGQLREESSFGKEKTVEDDQCRDRIVKKICGG